MQAFPFLRILVPAICGILVAEDLPGLGLTVIPFILGGIACLFIFHFKKLEAFFSIMLFALIFFLFAMLHQQEMKVTVLKEGNALRLVKAIGPSTSYSGGFACEVLIIPLNESKPARVKCRMQVRDTGFTALPGDFFLIDARAMLVRPPLNPGDFDYREYLKRRGIGSMLYVDEGKWKKTGFENSLTRIASRLREDFAARLNRGGLAGDEFAVVSALLIGAKDDLNEDLKAAYSSAGAMHVLAVSGLHVGVIFMVLLKLISGRFFQRHRFLRLIILLSALWFYALITGLSASVCRSSAMFSLVALSLVLDRKNTVLNSLAATAFFLLLLNTNWLFDVGFQLSFLAVFGIVRFQPVLKYAFQPSKKWTARAWELTVVSFTAQAFTFPLALLYFGQFPNYFLLSNFLVIPVTVGIIYTGFAFAVIGWIPFLDKVLGWILDVLVGLMNSSVEWIDSLPNAVSLIKADQPETIFSYLIVLSAFLLTRFKTAALLTFLSGCLILISFSIFNEWKIQSRDKIIVYSDYRSTALSLVNGKRHFFLTSDTGNVNRYQDNFRNSELSAPVVLPLSLKSGMLCLRNREEVFAVIDRSFKPENVDLMKKSSIQTVLISANYPAYSKARLISNLLKEGIRYFELEKTGALTITSFGDHPFPSFFPACAYAFSCDGYSFSEASSSPG